MENARPFHDAMPRHHTAGPCLGAVATGTPLPACSNRWPCLKSRPRRRGILAPGLALGARPGLWVRSAPPPAPSPCPLNVQPSGFPPSPPQQAYVSPLRRVVSVVLHGESSKRRCLWCNAAQPGCASQRPALAERS